MAHHAAATRPAVTAVVAIPLVGAPPTRAGDGPVGRRGAVVPPTAGTPRPAIRGLRRPRPRRPPRQPPSAWDPRAIAARCASATRTPIHDPPPGATAAADGPRHARRGDGDDGDGADGGPRRKRSWPQRVILGAGLVLVLFCMLGASVAGYTLVKYNEHRPGRDLELPPAAKGEPENFLIVAPDIREGHTSFNTDTIMVLRIDPKSDALALTSFPRDLIVTVADTGDTGMINAAYNRPDGTGPQNLINTLQQNYGVTIHHFVEVRFESFRQVVDAVGGVSMWFETAARDNTRASTPKTWAASTSMASGACSSCVPASSRS